MPDGENQSICTNNKSVFCNALFTLWFALWLYGLLYGLPPQNVLHDVHQGLLREVDGHGSVFIQLGLTS